MDESEIKSAVTAAYKKKYQKWPSVVILEVSRSAYAGWLVVVGGVMDDETPVDEVCFVPVDGKVRIFDTTIELARFLEERANASWLERVFNRSVLTGLVFPILILAIVVSGFFDFESKALAILGSVVGSAGGFFFASEKSASTDRRRSDTP